MNTTQASNLVEHLGAYNGLRLFRKHLYGLLDVCGAATVGLHVQDAGVWGTLTDVCAEPLGHSDHAERQMRRIGDPRRGDMHAVFHAPGRCGSPEVQRDVAPHAIVVHAGRSGQRQGTAAQDARGWGLRMPGGLDDDDDMERVCARLVEPLPLVYTGVERPCHGGCDAVRLRHLRRRPRVAILAPGTPSSRRDR